MHTATIGFPVFFFHYLSYELLTNTDVWVSRSWHGFVFSDLVQPVCVNAPPHYLWSLHTKALCTGGRPCMSGIWYIWVLDHLRGLDCTLQSNGPNNNNNNICTTSWLWSFNHCAHQLTWAMFNNSKGFVLMQCYQALVSFPNSDKQV